MLDYNGKKYAELSDFGNLEMGNESESNLLTYVVQSIPVDDAANIVNPGMKTAETHSTIDLLLTEVRRLHDRFDKIEKDIEEQKVAFSEFVSSFIQRPNLVESTNNQNTGTDIKEDYIEFEKMTRILDDTSLHEMEKALSDKSYFEKFIRYMTLKYDLDGRRDSKAFFKTVFRSTIAPCVLKPYSWKGNSRATHQGTDVVNVSFKMKYPKIVNFFDAIMASADCTFKTEQIEQYFDSFLRNKLKEMERETQREKRNLCPRASTSRKRKRNETKAEENKNENTKQTANDTPSTENLKKKIWGLKCKYSFQI